ncbi:hypothetical protein L207DRAFT_507994 [Hyaloscypha variabilis F]|uniref:F-box domain-containing protein n=1 Tax=Hyaloscypha variabilis (strain UAMH 11265 / GT02V1 / F) TaxID=1149755 RepID=A0A2J6S2W8_HYAVF|nr:hypothetical protein L207DRAFT_507994 [Hyaloscypha variabilis F]
MAVPTLLAQSKDTAMRAAGDAASIYTPDESCKRFFATYDTSPAPGDAWRQFTKTVPFLGVPPEIHLKIFTFLNPIDAVCLSLVNKYIYTISPPIDPYSHPLTIGEPSSDFPVEQIQGCKHCVPVRFFPHHCELHYHLRGFIPKELNFCGALCQKYTRCEQAGYSDSHEYCGTCGVSYWRRYERGRRHLEVRRPGQKQLRLCKWYNNPKF